MSTARAVASPLLFAALALSGAACKKTGTAPAIQGLSSADEARAGLLATVTIAGLDRTAAKVDAIARKLQLPFSGKDLVASLMAQQELPPEAAALLDGRRPTGLAFVATATNAPPAQAMAISARSAGDAEKLATALGTTDQRQGNARRIRRPGGQTLWLVVHGPLLISGPTFEAIRAAGALAIEAQRDVGEEVLARIHPDALARWRGTDVRTAVRRFRQEMVGDQIRDAEKRGAAVPGRAERLMLEATLDALLAPLAETTVSSLSFALDADRGLRFGVRLDPRAGSALAKRTRTKAPYAVDPALLAAGAAQPLGGLWASGASPFWLDLYDTLLAAQAAASVRGAAEVGQRWRALRPQLTGALNVGMRTGRQGLTYDFVIPAAGNGTGALDALAGLVAAPGFAELLREIYGKVAPEIRSARPAGALRAELAFPVRDRRGDVGTVLKALLGTSTVTALVTASRGRLIASTEPGAQPRLVALAAGAKEVAPPAEVAAALAATRGHDGFAYLDLWATLRPMLGVMPGIGAGEAQMLKLVTMALGDLKLPVVMSYRGGEALVIDLGVPMGTLSNAAGVLRPFLGLGGAGAAPTP